MKKEIAITNWKRDCWQYELPFNCKKILNIWVNNKKVNWKIIKMLDIDYFEKQDEITIKIEYIAKEKT